MMMYQFGHLGTIDPMFAARRASILPKTGQTTSYRTGDDGSVKAGKGHRFQTVCNLVYDYATMLCWVANPAAIIPGDVEGRAVGGPSTSAAKNNWQAQPYVYGDLVCNSAGDGKFYVCIQSHVTAQQPPNATYWVETVWTASAANLTTAVTVDWNNAIDKCLGLNYGGIGGWSETNPLGWRLPNVEDLRSLCDHGKGAYPSIVSPIALPSTAGYECWSSTTHSVSSGSAMCVMYQYGNIVESIVKTGLKQVLPVRSLI
jgi:hypothetical protein